MKSKLLEKTKISALYSLAIGPILIGGNLFLYFMDRIPWYESESARVFDYIQFNVGILAVFLGTIFFMNWRGKRRGNIPPVDERTLLIMKNYLLWVLSLLFFISAIILLVLLFLGIETIEIGWIFLYLSSWITLSILGAFIVTRV